MPINELSGRLSAIRWTFADADPVARRELERRIAEVGRKGGLVTYSELVKGVVFRLPTVNGGGPYQIDISNWSELDRALIGDFLGAISSDSYLQGGFLATALVVNQDQRMPSERFFTWLVELGVLRNAKERTILPFWSDQVSLAHAWYAQNAAAT